MRFLAIRKKIHEVGFDDYHQAGLPNRFHPINIVCDSLALNLRFWVCADGGYGVSETYHIASRPLDDCRTSCDYTSYKTQTEMIAGLEKIRLRIVEAAHKDRKSSSENSSTKET